jgi:hypothetical protein
MQIQETSWGTSSSSRGTWGGAGGARELLVQGHERDMGAQRQLQVRAFVERQSVHPRQRQDRAAVSILVHTDRQYVELSKDLHCLCGVDARPTLAHQQSVADLEPPKDRHDRAAGGEMSQSGLRCRRALVRKVPAECHRSIEDEDHQYL